MKMQRLTLALSLLILITAPAMGGQQAGDSEFQLQGSLSLDTGDSVANDSGSVNAVLGRFYTDRTELGMQGAAFFNSDGDLSGAIGPFGRYNFGTDDVVPYVGVGAFVSFGDFTRGDVLAQFEGGVRYFVSRNTAFTVGGIQYYDVDDSDLTDFLLIQFGFSHVWGKD